MSNPCKLTECQGKPRCGTCTVLDQRSLVQRLQTLGYAMRSHPVANSTIEGVEKAAELMLEAAASLQGQPGWQQCDQVNPWGLTDGQVRVMRAICQEGCHKLAARALNISLSTLVAHVRDAAMKMPQRGRMARYVAFDRWDRGIA